MKKLRLIALICVITIMLAGCGNMDVSGIGNYSYKKVHVDTNGYSGCIAIKSWLDGDVGIEVKTEDYGSMYLSEGTYILIEDVCPLCNSKEG